MNALHRQIALWTGALFVVLLTGCGATVVNGYTDSFSCYPGDSINLYIHAKKNRSAYPLCFTDLEGKIYNHFPTDLQPQLVQANEPFKNGFGYLSTATIKIPEVKSGIYRFGLKIPVLVKSRTSPEILILCSSNTENAYCAAGGNSLYHNNPEGETRTEQVSFLRPIDLPLHSTAFLKRIEGMRDSLEVGYVSDRDLDDYSHLEGVKVLVIPGHSEYWTRKARTNFDRFVDQGGHVLLLSGNTMWWQVRYTDDGTGMICYKSYQDPIEDTLLRTINWTKPELGYSVLCSIGLDFDHGGYGRKKDAGWDGFKIVSEKSPLLKNANKNLGEVIHLHSDEYDGAPLQFNADSTEVQLLNPCKFHRYELIGYDLASRLPGSNGAWIAMQKTPDSGMIINVASTDWCSKVGMEGPDAELIFQLTKDMIQALRSGDPDRVFSKK